MSKPSLVKKILVPLELNKSGEDLLCYAGQLAQACGAELLLFHACQTVDLTFTQQSRCIQKLRTFAERIFSMQRQDKAAAAFDCVVRPGRIEDSIKYVVEDFAVDLVLMGANATSGETTNFA